MGARCFDGDRAHVDRRRLGATKARQEPRDQLAADDPGLDQHGSQQDQAEKGRHRARGQGGHGLDLHLLVADLERARDRHAFAQNLVDQDDQDRTQARAEHPPAPAQDRGAADDHGGDDDQLGSQAILRGDALVLGDVHQAGQGRAQGGEHEAADAHDARVDAGILGRQRVAADGVGLVAPTGAGQDDAAHDRDQDEDQDLVVEAERVALAQREERELPGLDLEARWSCRR